jgi:hypothetical protein
MHDKQSHIDVVHGMDGGGRRRWRLTAGQPLAGRFGNIRRPGGVHSHDVSGTGWVQAGSYVATWRACMCRAAQPTRDKGAGACVPRNAAPRLMRRAAAPCGGTKFK